MDWLLPSAQHGYSLCCLFWLTIALCGVLRCDIPPSKVPVVRPMTDRCSSKLLVSVDVCSAIANLRAQFNRWIDQGSRQRSRKRQKGERGPREKNKKNKSAFGSDAAFSRPLQQLAFLWIVHFHSLLERRGSKRVDVFLYVSACASKCARRGSKQYCRWWKGQTHIYSAVHIQPVEFNPPFSAFILHQPFSGMFLLSSQRSTSWDVGLNQKLY